MNFLNPLGFLAFLSVPAIIMMYILKEKHKTENISSLFLWEKAVASAKAHEPWQKLKRNILMILQILTACFIAFALLRPYISGVSEGQKYIFVIDSSLSMQSTDKEPSRFEYAKAQIKDVIKDAPDNGEFSVIVMNTSPYVIKSSTNYKSDIIESIDKLKCENSSVSIEETEALIDLEMGQTGGNVYIFTDNDYDFSKQGANVISLGESNENMGIVSINHTTSNSSIDLLIKVKNFGTEQNNNTVTIYADNNILDSFDFTADAQEIKDIYIQGVDPKSKNIVAELSNNDILEKDNTAYHVIESEEKKKVLLVSKQNIFLEKIFQIIDNVELYKAETDNIEELSGYGLYVFDGIMPNKMPSDGHIFVFNPPEGNSFIQTNGTIEGGHAYGVENDSLINGININFAVSKMQDVKTPAWAKNSIMSNNNTAFFYGETEGRKTAVFTFDIHDSDFPLKKEFPIFMYNTINYIFPKNLGGRENIKAGDKIQFNVLPESTSVNVQSPNGTITTLAPPFPPSYFEGTEETGFYKLIQKNNSGEISENYFAVNCDVLKEGGFLAAKSKEISEEKAFKRNINKDLRNIFLIIALIALAFEWRINCRDN